MGLAYSMILNQFFHQPFDIAVQACQGFTLFCLEYDILYRFNLCGRSGKTALFHIGIDIGNAPFFQIEIRPLLIQ